MTREGVAPVRALGRVVVAMSGGVDSSVAAALLVEQGYEVIGVMMRLWAEEENRCCAPEAVGDARQVAARLGIPFYLVNYEREFRTCVVDYFIDEYSRGRTPNPCLACNRWIRFGRLLGHAQALDADYLATGHYSRVDCAGGRFRLRMAADSHKDQSYVLYMLGQDELRRVLFPVGAFTKAEVREFAKHLALPVADKDESMELCFVADDDYRKFLQQRVPQAVRPGPILNTVGEEIGEHQGLPFYTVGQRRGLGSLVRPSGSDATAPEAMYVIRLDLARNALIVGPARELGRRALIAESVSYLSGLTPRKAMRVKAKIRYKAALAGAMWTPMENARARVEFEESMRGITPGQAVVAYQDDVVLGGGIISEGEACSALRH
jgi:tRNA-specific 2-thiouridylase